MRTALALAALLLATALPALAGTVCIASFSANNDHLPNMSPEMWGPSPDSVFTFQIGKTGSASVHAGETASVKDVPADRKVLVRVKLDGRPFESFWLNLRKEPKQRACLWLYPATGTGSTPAGTKSTAAPASDQC